MQKLLLLALIGASLFAPARAMAQQDPSAIEPNADAVLMTVFLKQTQEMNLEEMTAAVRARGFWKIFPPEGVRIVGWYMLMSIGHLVILEVPPAKIRELNRSIEQASYGIYRSEVHPGYDFLPIVKALKEKYGQ